MGKFNRDNRDRDRDRDRDRGRNRGFDRRDSFNDRGRERREMHETVCSECGVVCEVPFKPTSSKPVYCDSCFGKRGREDRRFERSDRFENRRENKFVNSNNSSSKCDCNCKEGLDLLAKKLDILINVLTPKNQVKEVKKEEVKTDKKNIAIKKEEKGKEDKKIVKEKTPSKKKVTAKKKK